MSLSSQGGEIFAAITKSAPPVAVSSVVMAGTSLNEWVLIATLVYTLLQIGLLVRRLVRAYLKKEALSE